LFNNIVAQTLQKEKYNYQKKYKNYILILTTTKKCCNIHLSKW